MKYLVSLSSLLALFVTTTFVHATGHGDGVGGGSFSQSASAIQAIFQSPDVLKNASGPVQKIELRNQNGDTSEYAISILQWVFNKDSQCVLVSSTSVPCTFIVDLNWDGEKFQVINTDFSSCPAAPHLGCGSPIPGSFPKPPGNK
jgi:hypothetical protein